GIAVAVLAAVWVLLARGIRSRYLDVFRSTLQRGRLELSAGMPELDMSALEALIASLSSRKDAQVLGALDLLVETGRPDFVPVADRLLAHADAEVRTAALRARAAVERDPVFLLGLLD